MHYLLHWGKEGTDKAIPESLGKWSISLNLNGRGEALIVSLSSIFSPLPYWPGIKKLQQKVLRKIYALQVSVLF